ncbi:MAG: antibiotic biosynthesis monooxygenase [Propionicimonas sp.]
MSAVLAISRFQVTRDASHFRGMAESVVAHFNACVGSSGAEVVQNLDAPEMWAIISRWKDVGSYRRAFNGTDAKLLLIPLLSLAIDEPSAYAEPASVGENRPRGTVG